MEIEALEAILMDEFKGSEPSFISCFLFALLSNLIG